MKKRRITSTIKCPNCGKSCKLGHKCPHCNTKN